MSVVARPGTAQDAGGLIGLGVNRVVTLDMSEETIDRYVADLLDVAPRAAVRFKARLTTVLNDGKIEIIGLVWFPSLEWGSWCLFRVSCCGFRISFEPLWSSGAHGRLVCLLVRLCGSVRGFCCSS